MSDLLRRHGPKVAVGGLLAVNVALVGALALRDPVSSAVPAVPVPTSSSPSTDNSDPSASLSGDASPTRSPEPSASAGPSGRPGDETERGYRLLAANSGQVGWRAEATSCGGDATVEVSTDGGRSWSATDPGLTAIVRLKTYDDDSVLAVGADDECRPTYAWVTGPREAWQRDRDRVSDVWYRVPDDLDAVHAPGGAESRPCGEGLVDLAGLGTYRAAALCADGRIRTEDSGRSWRTVRRHSGAVSLNADDDGFLAAADRSACDGLVVHRFDTSGEGLESDGSCQPGATKGAAAVAVASDQTWVWRGRGVSVG